MTTHSKSRIGGATSHLSVAQRRERRKSDPLTYSSRVDSHREYDGSDNWLVRAANLRVLAIQWGQTDIAAKLRPQRKSQKTNVSTMAISRWVNGRDIAKRHNIREIEKAFGLWRCSMETFDDESVEQIDSLILNRLKVTPRQILNLYSNIDDLVTFSRTKGVKPYRMGRFTQRNPKMLFSPFLHPYGQACGFRPSKSEAKRFYATERWQNAQIYLFQLGSPNNLRWIDDDGFYHNLFVLKDDKIELGVPARFSDHKDAGEILGHCVCTIDHY